MTEYFINKRMNIDAMDLLKGLDDKSIDVILTDPPYDFSRGYKDDVLHKEFTRVCKGIIIVFAPPENQWVLPADQYGFWIKPISTKNTVKSYSRFVEMIFFYGRNKWNCDRHWSQYTNVFTDLVDDTAVHPFRKPPSLIERLILNHSDEGDLILDPFAGSFVVADICEKLHRNYICGDMK